MFLFNWFPVHHQYYSVLILLTIFYSYYDVFVRNLLNEFPIHLSTLSNVMANLTILDNIGQCCTKQYHSSTWLKFCVVDKITILFITSKKPEDWQNTFFLNRFVNILQPGNVKVQVWRLAMMYRHEGRRSTIKIYKIVSKYYLWWTRESVNNNMTLLMSLVKLHKWRK